MTQLDTFREWFAYSAWANEKLLAAAAPLEEAKLDQRFDMGLGSLLRTLLHILAGESVWLERWQERAETKWPDESERVDIPGLRARFDATHDQRRRFLSSLKPTDLERDVPYRDSKGSMYRASLRDMLVQGSVHSHHHRAQALNMLRCVGAELPKPGIDFIFKRLEDGQEKPVPCDAGLLATLFAYGDWANDVLLEVAAVLSEAQLDRPFEMGLGTLRKTLLHIRFAEQWWLENWTRGPGGLFPELPEATSAAQLRDLWTATRAARNAILGERVGPDLSRIVEAHPRPGVVRRFPLGVTMLQLCGHGVHHRAQAVNMMRRLTGSAPELDYMVRARVPA